MSKQDFQNGFAIGLTSGGVFSVADEKTISEYAKKHLKYRERYHYNVTDLKNYNIDSSSKAYSVECQINSKLIKEEYFYVLTIAFRLFTHDALRELLHSPLIVAEDDSGRYYENEADVTDAAIGVSDEILTLSYMAQSFADGENVVWGESRIYGSTRDNGMCMNCELSFFSKDRNVLDTMQEELLPFFTESDDFYLCYENNPCTTIEGDIYI